MNWVARGDRWSLTFRLEERVGLWLERPILFQNSNGQRMTPPIRPAWWELGKGREKLETRRQKVESRGEKIKIRMAT